jgi:Gametolysin peptidase M11
MRHGEFPCRRGRSVVGLLTIGMYLLRIRDCIALKQSVHGSIVALLNQDGAGTRAHHIASILCRITVESIHLANGTSQELSLCITIHKGEEEDHFLPMDLPESFLVSNRRLLVEGSLLVELSNITVHGSNHHIKMTERSKLRLLNAQEVADQYVRDTNQHLSVRGRRQREGSPVPPTQGNKTIAIVRISAPGSPNRFPKAKLTKVWFGADRSFQTQMTACSFGQLNWRSAGVHDIRLVQNVSTFATREEMQLAIERQLRNQTGKSMTELGDKVVFCYPKNSPGEWLASASLHGWRAMFNDGWCGSLSAAMHEIGHTVGLLHSGKSETENWEYSDTTGYMGFSILASSTPHKCFNGFNHWQLGWYPGRRRTLEIKPAVIRLAAFADYPRAAPNEPVLVRFANNLFLQYNRAKSFNSETPMFPDRVTVTRMRLDGRSENMAGLAMGESFTTEANTTIKACSSVSGKAGQDVMIVSIAGAPCP